MRPAGESGDRGGLGSGAITQSVSIGASGTAQSSGPKVIVGPAGVVSWDIVAGVGREDTAADKKRYVTKEGVLRACTEQ